jgi:hypothetical protein
MSASEYTGLPYLIIDLVALALVCVICVLTEEEDELARATATT